MDGLCICRCNGDICDVCRQISDAIISVRKSGADHGICGYLSEMCRTVFYSAYCGECVSKWNPGHGIWNSSNDAGVAELIGRGVVAIGAAHYKSYVGVCLASPAAWVLAGGLLLVMYFHIMKRYTEDLSGQK